MSTAMQADTSNQSGTILVSSMAELEQALSNAQGGEVISLAPGEYGDLSLNSGKQPFVKFSSELTIVSSDPDNPAVFSSLYLKGVENLTFDGVTFDYDAAIGAPDYERPFLITGSEDVTIKNSVFDGDLAEGLGEVLDGFGTGHGIDVSYSSGITIENNEFYDFKRAGVFANTDGLTVTDNNVHDIRSDGFDFAAVQDVLIEGNYIHDFNGAEGSGDHMDMIQFWTNGTTTPSSDVVIRGNFLDSGEGSPTQSIFMRNDMVDRGLAGSEMNYQNITIEDNVIYNAHIHGITVGETDGLTIKNNTILQNPDTATDESVTIPTINIKNTSTSVVIENNIVPRLDIDGSNGTILENNLVVQTENPDQPDYVGNLFVNALAGKGAELIDLQALPSGMIEQMGVGAELTAYGSVFGASGFVENEAGTGLQLLTHTFSASVLNDAKNAVDLSGAQVTWDFGDGNTGKGADFTHTFSNAGEYAVTANVKLSDGQVVQLSKTVVVQTPIAVKADFNDGALDLSDNASTVKMSDGVTYEKNGDGDAVRLNGNTLSFEQKPEFFNNSEYTVFVDFKKDAGNELSSGRLINFTNSFIVNVDKNGLSVAVITDQGTNWLRTGDIGLGDSDWHSLALTFSGDDGSAVLFLDGKEVARVEGLDGAVQVGSTSQPIFLGNPWGESFTGLIDNFAFVKGAMTPEDVAKGMSSLDDLSSLDPVDPVDPSEEPTEDDPVGDADGPSELNYIEGTDGDETLNGTNGADEIVGVGGKDRIYAGDGDDTVTLGDAHWGRAHGGDGNDTVNGGSANDVLFGEAGSDTLNGGDGADKLFGGTGDDLLSGGAGRNSLYGEAGDDILIVGDDDYNLLDGGDGNDQLIGGTGSGTHFGGAGNDTLFSGGGDDQMTGGADEDEFVFTVDSGKDIIHDFGITEDSVTLKGLAFSSVQEVLGSTFAAHGDLILNLDGPDGEFSWTESNYVRLVDVSIDDFLNANIDLVA